MEDDRKVIVDKLLSEDYDFEKLALRIFHFQYHHNPLYHEFCDYLDRPPEKISHLSQIPYLPIRFFKTHEIKTGDFSPDLIFKSSGTTESGRSRHLVRDRKIYNDISVRIFEEIYGPLENFRLLALLPSYLEQGDSSLIYMIRLFIRRTGFEGSQFYKFDFDRLRKDLENFGLDSKKILLWGVTFALLDFADQNIVDLNNHIIMETGGMKGRREELLRSEVHHNLTSRFNCKTIHSEYGMTEMLSQAYSTGNGSFQMGSTVKIMAFDVTDPLTKLQDQHSGRCHVIDLANVDSCSFIATDDLCRTNGNTFEILGRMDDADIRGCNLMYR